jgi:hypothetical protein
MARGQSSLSSFDMARSASRLPYEALHSQQHLDLLGGLAAQSQVYRVTFGPDLMDDPGLQQELVPQL